MQVFRIQNLAPGIAYFGLTFVMLFTSIQVSKDRTTALLLRLYASPMKPVEYIFGYTIPMVVLAVVQMVICFGVSVVIGLCTGDTLGISEMLLSVMALLPSVFLFVGFGILFGTLVNEKAAQGTQLAHTDGGVPNLVVEIPALTAYHFGELVYFFEKACGISGYMLGVNPFDQPGVEAYKKNMFVLLGKPGYEAQKAELEERLSQ